MPSCETILLGSDIGTGGVRTVAVSKSGDVLDQVSGTFGGKVFSTGGGSRNDLGMQCRADVAGGAVPRPACPESAVGSAVLAAAGTMYGVEEAIARMVREERIFVPDPRRAPAAEDLYHRFRAELERRGYL